MTTAKGKDFAGGEGTAVNYTATVPLLVELDTGGFGHRITLDPDGDAWTARVATMWR